MLWLESLLDLAVVLAASPTFGLSAYAGRRTGRALNVCLLPRSDLTTKAGRPVSSPWFPSSAGAPVVPPMLETSLTGEKEFMIRTSGHPLALHSEGRRSMSDGDDRLSSWIGDFACAGVSSMLLVVAHLIAQFSPFYLLALLPYAWRTLHLDRRRAIRLAVFLATSFCFVAYARNLIGNPGLFSFQLFYLNLVFVSYGIAVHRARVVFGASPLFVVSLWLPIEYCLNNFSGQGRLFAISAVEPSLGLRLSILLDLLIIPLIIILLNPLLLWLASVIVSRLTSQRGLLLALPENKFLVVECPIRIRHYYSIPVSRGPP